MAHNTSPGALPGAVILSGSLPPKRRVASVALSLLQGCWQRRRAPNSELRRDGNQGGRKCGCSSASNVDGVIRGLQGEMDHVRPQIFVANIIPIHAWSSLGSNS